MLTSIIIPTFNHRDFVGDAIDSALAQNSPVEVIVIDDGSTDGTAEVLRRYDRTPVRLFEQKHAGPSVARNKGLDAARGDFVMFLDADDIIAADKVSTQIKNMTPEVGFVVCDVRYQFEDGQTQLASERYDYKTKDIGGWIADKLLGANFIPNMSPLYRRSVLSGIRFHPTREPEDWHFIVSVANAARCRYIPDVLATYRRQNSGRNNTRKRAPWSAPGVKMPLRLNLGCGTPGTRSWHPIPGLVNLDKSLGYKHEDGLVDFVDGSVDGITVSHSLMYLRGEDWPAFMREVSRVLKPGGVIRITEDDTEHPESRTYRHGWQGSQPAVCLTGPKMVRGHLEAAGFAVYDVDEKTTRYKNRSLCQAQHGPRPDVFFIEGVRESAVLFEPHADDGALFAAYSILRHSPRVVTCFPSARDYGDTEVRHAETKEAMAILGGGPCEQWDGGDVAARMRELDRQFKPQRVFAPSENASHPEHVAVALASREVFGDRVIPYQTYNADGKVRGEPVSFEPEWPALKQRALLCYRTQLEHPRAQTFFNWDLDEYR